MDLSVLKNHGFRAFGALLGLTICAGTMQAANLLTATATVAVTCSTSAGPGAPANIVVKPVTALSGAATINVTVGVPGAGLVITNPVSQVLNAANSVAGITYTVNTINGCVGTSTGAVTVRFSAGGVLDVTSTVNDTLTATASGLVASAVTISCARSAGPVYTPGPAQTVSVTSMAAGGTAFTVDTTVAPPPAWLTVTPTTGGTASSTPVTFTVAAAAGCGAFAAGSSTTATLHLVNAPAPDKLVAITLQVVPPSSLVATPSPASLTYVRGSGTAGYVDIRVTSPTTPAPFFSLNTASLPIWLTVDSTTGTVPKSIRFSTTSVCDTLAPGTYSATVYLKVSGSADLAVPISLLVNNKAPKLSVAEGTTRNLSWTIGTALPTAFITAVSSDSPISYKATTGGSLGPVVNAAQQSGLAYSFGTQIGVSFNPLIFAAAQPGSILTGTVTLTWGSPASTIVVTFNIAIQSPGATVNGLNPASLPTAAAGQTFNVVLTGTGFVPSTDVLQKTKVGVVVGGALAIDTNISANVINPSNIILTITVPVVPDANLPFAPGGTGGSVVFGICNPAGATCSIPSGTATLTIGSGPIVQAVTSASAFIQVAPPALPTVSPYDMLSIFGANFCSSGGTGCSSSQILFGTPDATLRYATSLSPDAAGPTRRALSVTFQTHTGTPTVFATAPLLFGTNGQINLLVPEAVTTYIGSIVDVVVNFGYATGATMKSSAPFPVNIAATNPGIFTIGASGQGDGAILDSAYAVVSSTNPAGMRATATDSDVVQFYVTGLGAPDSTGDNASTGSAAWSADCVSLASYLTSLNSSAGSSLLNLDGNVIQSGLLNTNRLPPCVLSGSANVPSVTIGGVPATVLYAGFVPDSIAGLFQINATLPGTGDGPFTSATGTAVSTITTGVQLPVAVTANGVVSQSGVTLWVSPRLKVVGLSGAGLTGTVGVPWSSSSNTVTATQGTPAYRYALTSGLLPSGLSLNASTGAVTGTPAAHTSGSYAVTVTATDSANVPVKGSVSFTLTVAGGLFMTSTGTAPYYGTFGTASASLTTVKATGGVFPYFFAITTPASIPVGMTVNATSGVVGTTALTPPGTYTVAVTSTDSTAPTPLTGSITFDIVVALRLSHTTPVSQVHGVPGTLSTVSVTGSTGTIAYSLDAASLAAGFTIDSSTGAVGSGTAVAGSASVTVLATDDTAPANAASPGVGITTFAVTVT